MLQVVAGTFNVVKAGRFYGRYWGAFETVKNLHFEACCECINSCTALRTSRERNHRDIGTHVGDADGRPCGMSPGHCGGLWLPVLWSK